MPSETRSNKAHVAIWLFLGGALLVGDAGISYGTITSLAMNPSAPTCTNEIWLNVSGYFADGCWRLDRVDPSINGNTILLEVYGRDTWDGTFGCAQQPVSFSENSLVGPFPEGEYLVHAQEILTTARCCPAQESRDFTFDVQCCTPTPGYVSDLQVSITGQQIHIGWSDVQDAEDYVLYQEVSSGGLFQTVAATSQSGQSGLTLPLPSQSMYYLIAGRNSTCGEGLKH